jgi:hypothetical protein
VNSACLRVCTNACCMSFEHRSGMAMHVDADQCSLSTVTTHACKESESVNSACLLVCMSACACILSTDHA